jgi:sugar lactone lactonase YvrE
MALGFAPAARAQVLYWLDTSFGAPTLNKSDGFGNAISSIAVGPQTLPEGLACDAAGNVYWTEAVVNNGRIQRAGPTFGNIQTLISGNSMPRGIAVDDAAGLMYWTTSNVFVGSTVRRASLHGGPLTNLILLGSGANPRGIAVDHPGGKIYWADFDANAIYRANLDGTGMELFQQLVAKTHPYGVAVDPITQMLLWTEYQTGRIRRAPLAGGAITSLVSGLSNPTYLTIDLGTLQIYWSEGGVGAQHLYRAPLGGGARTALALPLTTYGGVAFVSNPNVSTPPAPPKGPPLDFALAFLSANPSRGALKAEFAVPRESHVRVSVIDLQGREVGVLAEGTYPAGRHVATWEVTSSAPAGIYFVRMVSGGRSWMRRLVRTR